MAVDPVTLALYMKGALCLFLASGGVAAIVLGYRVYCDKASARARMLVELESLKVTAHGAGAVIMATAVVWGGFAVWASPNLKSGNGTTEVYAFDTSSGSVQVPAITAFELRPGIGTVMAIEPDSLVSSFTTAAQSEDVVVTATKIEGQPAKFALAQVTAVQEGTNLVLRVPVDSANMSAVVEYRPVMRDSAFVFQPTSARVLAGRGDPPTQ